MWRRRSFARATLPVVYVRQYVVPEGRVLGLRCEFESLQRQPHSLVEVRLGIQIRLRKKEVPFRKSWVAEDGLFQGVDLSLEVAGLLVETREVECGLVVLRVLLEFFEILNRRSEKLIVTAGHRA